MHGKAFNNNLLFIGRTILPLCLLFLRKAIPFDDVITFSLRMRLSISEKNTKYKSTPSNRCDCSGI